MAAESGAARSSQRSEATDESAPVEAPYIRIRLTAIDHVQTPVKQLPRALASDRSQTDERYHSLPYVFRSSPILGTDVAIERAPVVRIFGATEGGQRCCLHVHGHLPYVYVEYTGGRKPSEDKAAKAGDLAAGEAED